MEQTQNRAILISTLTIFSIWLINGVYLSALSHLSVGAYWAADFTQWIVVPGTLIYWLKYAKSISPSHYGFTLVSKSLASTIAFGILAAFAFYFIFFLARDFAWRHLGHPTGYFSVADVFPKGPLGTVSWLYAAVSAGLVESIFFISLPWLLWSRLKLGPTRQFLLLSAVAFGIVHWEQGPHIVFAALAFGIAACYWYVELSSIWPVVIGHVIVDLIAFK